MKPRLWCLLLVVLCGAGALPAAAADAGLYTIVDGEAHVLRGTTWFDLVAGAPAQEGDVVDVRDGGVVQVELTRGAIVNLAGPAAAYAAALPASGPADWIFAHGWAKATALPASPLRLRSSILEVDAVDAVVVTQLEPASSSAFVERGSAKVTLPAARGKAAPAGELRDGEFVSRAAERTPAFGDRAPVVFVTAMPRYMRDPLPKMAPRFQGKPPALSGAREISLAEADAWLAGPTRAAFVKRFAPRLKDAEFRNAVAARVSAYPEWARVVRPPEPPPSSGETPAEGDHPRESP